MREIRGDGWLILKRKTRGLASLPDRASTLGRYRSSVSVLGIRPSTASCRTRSSLASYQPTHLPAALLEPAERAGFLQRDALFGVVRRGGRHPSAAAAGHVDDVAGGRLRHLRH